MFISVQQGDSVIHKLIYSFFFLIFFSVMVYHRILDVVLCVIQQDLVHLSIPYIIAYICHPTLPVHPSPDLSLFTTTSLCSMLWVSFCFIDRFLCVVFRFHVWGIIWYLSSSWLTSLSTVISCCTHVAFFWFFFGLVIFHCIYVPHLLYLSAYFHTLAIVNSAVMNIGVHVSFWIIVLSGYTCRRGIAGSNSSFLGKLHTVFQNGCTNLHSHQRVQGSLFSTSSLAFAVCRVFNAGHSNHGCEVVLHFIG